MSEKPSPSKKRITPDWFVQGVLTKIGDTFDRLTGRGWKPSSSLATSELIEQLKRMVDAEARVVGNRKYVPHNIKLKMQWDKFSADADEPLRKLETELLTALVDHINDSRYYTYAPISLEVKPDYFTSGVKLFAGFEDPNEDEREASIDVSLPGSKEEIPVEPLSKPRSASVTAKFELNGQPVEKVVELEMGKRTSVGRTKENDIVIDDASVSKMHASMMLNSDGQLVIADTGSTNGTFIDGERISYGKAVAISSSKKLKIGTVEIGFEITMQPDPPAPEPVPEQELKETYSVGDFEFTSKIGDESERAAETVASILVPEAEEGDEVPAATEPSIDINRTGSEQASK